MSKQIQYAGYSILKDGTWKFRTATDEKRIYQLEAFGESVYMVSIKPVTSKGAAAKELLAMDYMSKDPACVAFFVKHARDENPFAKPKKKSGTVRVKSTKSDPVEAYFMAVEADDVKLTPKQAAKLRAEFNERVRIAYEAN
jgi:type IV secretory pathway TrbF-like protein